jgi:anti-anti-sigma regulatory factor
VSELAQVRLDDAQLDEGVASLRWLLLELLASGAVSIVVDVRGVRLTPAAARALLAAHRACRRRGGGVTLRGPSSASTGMLRRTGLWRVLDVQPEDAL